MRAFDQLENPDTDLYVLAAWLRNHNLDVDLHKHRSMEEWEKMQKEHPEIAKNLHFIPVMSPYQLYVTGPFGKISVIRGSTSLGDFEIYSLEGDLFGGIRRYREVKHAGKTIHNLLTTGMFDESVPRVFSALNDLFGDDYGPDGSVQEIIE